jgi:hypothetical protein
MITSARVDNGTIVLLNEQGLPGTRIGNQFVVAGVCGEDLICVTKHGEVQHYTIEGGQRPVFARSLGKSHDPVSVQVGSGLNFSVTRSNGQTDHYVSGMKTRTTGDAKTECSVQVETYTKAESEYSTPVHDYSNAEESNGFLARIGDKCKSLFVDPIPGPWAKIVVWFSVLSSIGAAGVVATRASNLDSNQMIAIMCLLAINIGASYWLRNVIAKVLVRSWYGAPLVVLGALISQSYPEVGGFVILAGVVAWFWPIWPLALIVGGVACVVMAAAGKSAQTMDKR